MLDVLGLGLIIPVAPKLVEQLSGKDDAHAAPLVAALAALYAGMQFVFAPILGSLSDRYGRRPVILISLLGSGIDYLAMAVSPRLWWLFVTRAVNGISGANITAAGAYVADVTPPEKRSVGFGIIGAAFGLGFILGPLTGGWLGSYDLRLPFVGAGVLTLINWLYGLIVLPESLPADRRRTFSFRRANPMGAIVGLGRHPVVAGLAAAAFLVNVAQFGLHATWVLYTAHRYKWDNMHVGISLAVVGLGAAIVQGGLARRIIPAIGDRRALIMGMAVGVCAYLGYAFATEGWMIYAIVAVASLGAISQPAAQSLMSRSVLPDEQGELQGALASLQSLAGIIGPLIGGSVFGYFISDKAPVYLPGAPFITSALIAGCGWVVITWTLMKHGTEIPPVPRHEEIPPASEVVSAATEE